MTATAEPSPAHVATEMRLIPLSKLSDHTANPRKHFDAAEMAELTASVKARGVLVPISVRPVGKTFQILGGARRFRAAKAAGLEEILAVVREVDDDTALELVILDNLQRADLHPLEEAAGFHALSRQPGYDVAKVAHRVGRSPAYVYDRLKLLSLTKEAQADFLAGKFTAGHAILIARQSPKDQARILKPDAWAVYENEDVELFVGKPPVKTRSVRELSGWIDDHVKFDIKAPDALELFPETHAAVTAAREKNDTIVLISHDWNVPAGTSEQKIYANGAWKRADGKESSKPCAVAVLGVIPLGPGRGDAFRVCVDKGCKVHWAQEQRAAKASKSAARRNSSVSAGLARDSWQHEEKRRQAANARWKKALPSVLEAIAERVPKLSAASTGPLADVLVYKILHGDKPRTAVPRGKTAEDLIRHVAFQILSQRAGEYNAATHFRSIAKPLGIDVKKIVDAAAPPEKPKPAKAAKKKGRKK